MKKRITIKDIAEKLNVSIATVSRALNDSHEIGSKTKKRIKEYAKKNGYKPNRIALSLLKKKTKTIGVVIPNIMNSFFTRVVVGIEREAEMRGYNTISCISNESLSKEINTLELLKNGTIDGFIISLSEETQTKGEYKHINEAMEDGFPVVMFDRVSDYVECDKVIVDDERGAYNATCHLIKTGKKKIAVISLIDNLSVGQLRVKGYKKALTENNIDVEERLVVKIKENEDFDVAMKIVLADKSVDALLCLEEASAISSLKIVKQMHYIIPDQMSIISFTNGKVPRYVTPTISTLSQHGKHIGETAARTLIDRLESEHNMAYTTRIIKTSLIERESTIKLI